MRTIKKTVCLLTFILCSCVNEETPELMESVRSDCNATFPSTSPNTIMPLGASRVEGARPEYESFRYPLWRLLIDSGKTFDFIGTECDDATYAIHAGQIFDGNHEGRGGWTSGQILSVLNSSLNTTGAPDIVLFSSPGGNDFLENLSDDGVIENINNIIDLLQAANPNIIIIIEKMAPLRSDLMVATLTQLLDQAHAAIEEIAQNQSDGSSTVQVVDMSSGFSDAFLADELHYNDQGAAFVANRYYQVLQNYLE